MADYDWGPAPQKGKTLTIKVWVADPYPTIEKQMYNNDVIKYLVAKALREDPELKKATGGPQYILVTEVEDLVYKRVVDN